MKKLFLALLIFSFSVPAYAEDDTELKPRDSKKRTKLRHERRREKTKFYDNQLEFVKPFTSYTVETTPASTSSTLNNSSHSEMGIRYTYAPLKKGTWGYVFSGGYFSYGGGNSGSLRFEGGGSYTFSKMLYAMAGLNLQKFLDASTTQVIDLGYGVQAIFGMQITREFGVKLGVTYTTFTEKEMDIPIIGTVKFKYTFVSPEIGLYWAF